MEEKKTGKGTSLTPTEEGEPPKPKLVTPDQVAVIKQVIAPDLTEPELQLFFFECARNGVHPMDRMIYPTVYEDDNGRRKLTFITSIDLMRARAEATGEYRGQGDVEYGPFIKWEDIVKSVPEWARVTIIRRDPATGETYQVSARADWDEYYPDKKKQQWMWKRRPKGQLSKCAEALALRKSFPRQLRNTYSTEEMDQSGVIDVTPMGNKTATVKPEKDHDEGGNGAPGGQANGAPRRAPTVKDTLRLEALYNLQGDESKLASLIKDLSLWTEKNKQKDGTVITKEHFATAVEKLTEKWAEKCLDRLRKRPSYQPLPIEAEVVEEKASATDPEVQAPETNPAPDPKAPEGCPGDGEKCDSLTWRGKQGWCDEGDRECSWV